MKIQNLLEDIQFQYEWRNLYGKCHDFVDGQQISPEQHEASQRLDLSLRVFNLISAPIKTLIGAEVKTRVDYLLKARNEESVNASNGLNAELNRFEKTTKANKKISKAFKNAAIGGVGFVRIRKNPFVGDKYTVESLPPENVYWDMQRDNELLENSQWVAVRSVLDIDEAKSLFPKHAKDIEAQRNSNSYFNFSNGSVYAFTSDSSRTFRNDIINNAESTIAVHEVFYKKYSIVEVWTDDTGTQYNIKDLDKAFVSQLRIQKLTAKKTKTTIWRAVYIGYFEAENKKASQPHNEFEIVPLWGNITNSYNTPRGIVADMIDPQTDYNHYKFEIRKTFGNKQIMVEEESLDMSMSDIIQEANRADSVFKVKKNAQYPVINREYKDLPGFYRLLEVAKQEIRDCSGLTFSFTGDIAGASGKALSTSAELAQQSVVALFDSRDSCKTKIGEIALSYIIDDIGSKETVLQLDKGNKQITINGTAETGESLNPIAEIKYDIQLSSIKTSAGYKQLQADRIASIIANTKEANIQAILTRTAIDLEDVPGKDSILPMIDKKLGLEGLSDDKDAEEQRDQEEKQAQQAKQEKEQMIFELEMADKEAQIEDKIASAELKKAQAVKALEEAEANSTPENISDLHL